MINCFFRQLGPSRLRVLRDICATTLAGVVCPRGTLNADLVEPFGESNNAIFVTEMVRVDPFRKELNSRTVKLTKINQYLRSFS